MKKKKAIRRTTEEEIRKHIARKTRHETNIAARKRLGRTNDEIRRTTEEEIRTHIARKKKQENGLLGRDSEETRIDSPL